MADSQGPARCRWWLAALAVAATACAPEVVPIQLWMIDVERPCVGNCKPWQVVPCEGSPPPPAECVD